VHSSCDSRFVFFAFYNNSIFHSFVLRPMEPTLLSAHNCTFVFLFLNLDNLSRFDLYCIIHNLLHLPFKYSQFFLFHFHSILLHTKDIARCCVCVCVCFDSWACPQSNWDNRWHIVQWLWIIDAEKYLIDLGPTISYIYYAREYSGVHCSFFLLEIKGSFQF